MTLASLLQQSQEAIVRRWCAEALATYAEAAAAALQREQDPFANPVGHSLRTGTRAIFEGLCAGQGPDVLRASLEPIIKIRAVQEFSASRAVAFIFGLKDAIRAELRDAVAEPRVSSELAEFERRIDGVALAAFDLFVQCRQQISELRINEVKRNVSWIVEQLNRRGLFPVSNPLEPGGAAPAGRNGQSGDRS
jgi:hypothetical protein